MHAHRVLPSSLKHRLPPNFHEIDDEPNDNRKLATKSWNFSLKKRTRYNLEGLLNYLIAITFGLLVALDRFLRARQVVLQFQP